MQKSNVKLGWISNDAVRRATYRKRKAGIWKKLNEISIRCAIRACCVIYGPSNPTPEVWPGTAEAASMLSEFREMPETKRSKRMFNQEGFGRDRIQKMRQQVEKMKRACGELHLESLWYRSVAKASPVFAIAGYPASEKYYINCTTVTSDLGLSDIVHLIHVFDRKKGVVDGRAQNLLPSQPMVVADADAPLQPISFFLKPQFQLTQLSPNPVELQRVDMVGTEMVQNQTEIGHLMEQANPGPADDLYALNGSNSCPDYATMLADMMKESSLDQIHQGGPSNIWSAVPPTEFSTMASEMENPLLSGVNDSGFHPDAGTSDGFLDFAP